MPGSDSLTYHVEAVLAGDTPTPAPQPTWRLVAVYAALGLFLTWPAVLHLGDTVVGADRTDLWNTLWSLDHMASAVAEGRVPWRTHALGFPDGGVLLPADLLNGLLAAPLVWAFGAATAWGLCVQAHLAFSGLGAHLLARHLHRTDRAGWVAGVAWTAAPVLISGLHNGTSEAVGGGWLPIAIWLCLRIERSWARVGVAAAGLALALAASWYFGVCALLAAAFLAVSRRSPRVLLAVVLGAAAVLPLAVATHRAAEHPEGLVLIKNDNEVALVRRASGPVDPRTWVTPGDFRSPDFRDFSAFGEGFVHCTYLGLSLILLAPWGLTRRTGFLAVSGLVALVLASGPVLVWSGRPVLIDDHLVVALPYALLEHVPGFSGLSLLYRLGALPTLAVAVLAGGAVAGRGGRWAPGLLALVVYADLRGASPTSALPDRVDVTVPAPLEVLRDAPEGAVLVYPLAGGRPHLYDQLTHRKPLAAILNFPANDAAHRVWRVALQQSARGGSSDSLRRHVASAAEREGVRYLVVRKEADTRPDLHAGAVAALERALEPLAADDRVAVYALW